jgi:predicted dehydrogenase
MKRRDFLELAAAAGAGRPRRIRTGILGIQHSHLEGKLEAMRASLCYELVAVAEPDEATRRARQHLPALRGLEWVSVEELLKDASLELVLFEGEVKDAIPLGKRVIEAGKHLHLEKPPGNRMEPFRELVELARARGRLLQLGYLWRFHEGTDRALEAMRQGWLGDVFLIRATIHSDRDPAQRAVEARYGGGSMFELAGHMIDRILCFLGRPLRVHHWLRHDSRFADTLNDHTLAVFEYPKALAVVSSAAMMGGAGPHRSFEVIGTDGTFFIQPMEPAPILRVFLRAPRGPYRAGWQQLELAPQPRFTADFRELADAILSARPLQYSYDHELLLQETLLRASGELDGG